MSMQKYFGALTILLLLGLVLTRVRMLKNRGIKAMHFAGTDKSDFLILPFALFYFYTVFAHAFGFPTPGGPALFDYAIVGWVGVLSCTSGLILLYWSLVSFGNSFRVGIDQDSPDKLITTGVYEVTRNPIYLAFWLVLLGEFLIFPNWILLIFFVCSIFLIHRQVLREEVFLRNYYGLVYEDYCGHVRRYF
jgi:protein-S-isoprenylcysteine O-methyltransferase Ste14